MGRGGGKGTGGDGGSYPPTHEQYQWMLYGATKKQDKMNPSDVAANKWQFCSVSNVLLAPPVVMCPLGRLYNKEEVLHKLVHKTLEEEYNHLKSLKDLRDVTLSPNPEYSQKDANSAGESKIKSPFVCPIANVEMNGRYKFRSLPCGCVLSERALANIKTADCPYCQKPYAADDVIIVNPNEEEERELRARLEAKREQQKKDKKEKTKKKEDGGEKKAGEHGEEKEKKKDKGEKRPAESVIASLSAKKAAVQAAESLTKTKETSSVYSSLFRDKNSKDKRNFISTK